MISVKALDKWVEEGDSYFCPHCGTKMIGGDEDEDV